MKRVNTVIVGGGQAGLAMSHCLGERGIDHVVLERGRVAESWRSERWDSLRLLTPRWQSRLPGWSYRGPDPDGYMSMPEVIGYLEGYARSFDAPVYERTSVQSVVASDGGYRILTDQGSWRAENVVVATGACGKPFIPTFASELDARVEQVVPSRYKNPDQLPEGGVLVVGASASGAQLADEIHASGRPVTLSVAEHTRLPRTYRGMDILWWLDTMGIFDERADQVPDLRASRGQPSLQLVGSPERRTLDLASLAARGVRLVGRAVGADRDSMWFADDLPANVARAERKLDKLLGRIDDFVEFAGLGAAVGVADPRPIVPLEPAPRRIVLADHGIRSIVWATGFRQNLPWLHVPVLDRNGAIVHDGGVTRAAGLYVLGLFFLRRRNSNFIDGVGKDAAEIATHIARAAHGPSSRAA